MSKFVIDSNIFFGVIISSREIYFEIIKKFDLYTPDFALKEMEKYEELRKKGFSNIFLFEDFLEKFLH